MINNVFILPYDLRKTNNIATIKLNKLINCNNQSYVETNTIADLSINDHIIIYPSSKMLFKNYSKINCNISLILEEPKTIQKKYYSILWILRKKFYTIFVRYTDLENNNIFCIPIARNWIPKLDLKDFQEKNTLLSIVSSKKNILLGHKLRHNIIKEIQSSDKNDIDILGRGYKPFKNSKDGYLPYMFSVVIENIQEKDYFTEKLINCIACKTIPIYWGAPNIKEYFNQKGILTFNTVDELMDIISNINQSSYSTLIPYIEENYSLALRLSNTEKFISNILTKDI